MKWRCLVAAVLWLAILSPALALGPDEVLSDAALEARARSLSKELRCMVCQNQSIDDSDAPLARDLRILVRERLQAGESDQQVINFPVFTNFIFSDSARYETVPNLALQRCPPAPPHQRWSDRYDCERSRSEIAHPLSASSRSACWRRRPRRHRAARRCGTFPAADKPGSDVDRLCPGCPAPDGICRHRRQGEARRHVGPREDC